MTVLQINSNIPQDERSFGEFSAKATEMLSKSLKKNSSYIQIIYNRALISFGNQTGASTLVTLSCPDITQEQIEDLVGPLSKLLERLIGATPPTTYIRFEDLERSSTAWNGRMIK